MVVWKTVVCSGAGFATLYDYYWGWIALVGYCNFFVMVAIVLLEMEDFARWPAEIKLARHKQQRM